MDGLVRQSIDAQGGFAIIIAGSLLQLVSALITQLSQWQIWLKPAIALLVLVPIITWMLARWVSNWRRNRAKVALTTTGV